MMPMQNDSNAVNPPQDNQGDGETTPMDEVISKVQSYVDDPKLVTPQTMGELLADLQDLKQVVDGENPQDQTSPVMQAIQATQNTRGGQ